MKRVQARVRTNGVSLESTIAVLKALKSLGKTHVRNVSLWSLNPYRIIVHMNGLYYGIWDDARNTFVD